MIKFYGVKDPVATQFNPQLEHFDYICGQIQNKNKILRYVVIVSCLAFFLSIGLTLYAIAQPESIPVLVTMNDFGQTQYIGKVTRRNFQNFNVPEIAIEYQVKEFINLYYTLSTDKIVMNKSLAKMYHLLTSTTASKFTTMIKEEKPFDEFGDITRDVIFQTEPLTLSKNTYQIDFQVITRTLEGTIRDNKTYRSVISTKMLEPSQDDLKDNPLGIYISAFDIKEINTQAQNINKTQGEE